ncbi:hypothetical protein [Paludisphaera mucosa]|uniref:Tryptophan-rich sensory protein n=1 Tax=Paludisphaera mucosa TaxID=3030827 RepID=A0ABT6FEF9_9BACT|nr:hypothetical protein [Paludisphaera mucosa]MDG3005955.1 hypothetical protein [Paludisphaera mucosa]
MISKKSARRLLDPINSLAWFSMDGFWLAKAPWPAYPAMALTLATGGLLLAMSRRRGEDLALNAWMWMNALWLISDLGDLPKVRYAAMAVGGLGAILLASSLRPSKRRRRPLRRFRKIRRAEG